MNELDCGDNSCLFAERKGGMRTNGGCRCLDELPADRRRVATAHILALGAEVQRQRELITGLEARLGSTR